MGGRLFLLALLPNGTYTQESMDSRTADSASKGIEDPKDTAAFMWGSGGEACT